MPPLDLTPPGTPPDPLFVQSMISIEHFARSVALVAKATPRTIELERSWLRRVALVDGLADVNVLPDVVVSRVFHELLEMRIVRSSQLLEKLKP